MAEPSDQPPTPLLLRWQGCLPAAPEVLHRLEQLTGAVLMLLLAGLPFVSRSGLALEILACGLLWLLWSVSTPPGRHGAISSWLLLILAVAVISTGWSPVPMAAAKGLLAIELRRSLCPDSPVAHHQSPVVGPTAGRPADRWTAQQRAGAPAVVRLHRRVGALGRSSLDQRRHDSDLWPPRQSQSPGGVPAPPHPPGGCGSVALARLGRRIFAAITGLLGAAAVVFTYSRGGWLGLLAALAVLVLLLLMRSTAQWPPLWRRLVPLGALFLGGLLVVVAATQLEPIRTRVVSLLAGRGDSSNNFRINVWLAAIAMVQDRPWLGIGPGNDAFNSIYPLYQQPKFNALSAYSVPLELLVEMGIPGLLASCGLLMSSIRAGLHLEGSAGLIAIGSLAAITGLITQGITDTIFFRPEVQLIGWFCLASLARRSEQRPC